MLVFSANNIHSPGLQLLLTTVLTYREDDDGSGGRTSTEKFVALLFFYYLLCHLTIVQDPFFRGSKPMASRILPEEYQRRQNKIYLAQVW